MMEGREGFVCTNLEATNNVPMTRLIYLTNITSFDVSIFGENLL